MEEKNYYYQIGDIIGQFKIIKRWYGVKFSTSGIRKCCSNVIVSHKGYTFKYTSK